jgi:hypothetical protein
MGFRAMKPYREKVGGMQFLREWLDGDSVGMMKSPSEVKQFRSSMTTRGTSKLIQRHFKSDYSNEGGANGSAPYTTVSERQSINGLRGGR